MRETILAELSLGARRDLLRVLTSPSNVRADVIRQFHERERGRMVEVLPDLDADELGRSIRFSKATPDARVVAPPLAS
jgi:hypothetical protein